MNYTRILIIAFITPLFVACKKDQIDPPCPAVEIVPDQYIPEITQSILKISHRETCHDNSFTIADNYVTDLEYRFVEGVQVEDSYYYGIQRRINSSYLNHSLGPVPSWADTGAWENQSGYYRYSFDEKKSYLCSSQSDPNPTLLFDFNVNVGDTIDLGMGIISSVFEVVVQDITTTMMNGVSVPVISCKRPGFSVYTIFVVTPELPNPFMFENEAVYEQVENLVVPSACNWTNGSNIFGEGKRSTGLWQYYY